MTLSYLHKAGKSAVRKKGPGGILLYITECVFIAIFKVFAHTAQHNRDKQNQHCLSDSQHATQKPDQNKKVFI